jgi:hypothetical protein
MTVCPVALAVGCRKCPIFSVCPLKSVIGDQKPAEPAAQESRDGKSDQRKERR